MSEPDSNETLNRAQPDGPEHGEERAASPFDHPAFLPVLVFAMALWFGYDGWFNETIESVRFNRYGFGFLCGAAIYFTLVERTRARFLLPLLLCGYALWLAGLGWLGSSNAWYSDVESARAFNRYGALTAIGLAAVAALRDWLALRREASAASSDR
ncbi:MAG TPA: hypothetical protein VMS55_23745 [Myxococcota bacterium]|nr:hypothetical protein [Myxococcota bacterium]